MAGRRAVAGIAFAFAALVAALALALAGRDAGSRAAAGTAALGLNQIGNFNFPVHVDNAPKARKLLFVVEQPGTIRVLRKNRKLRKPFLDLSDRVQFGGEEGLLSIAFHPKYRKNRRFFVYYVNNGGNIEVDQFKGKKKKPTRARPKSRRQVIEIPHPGQSNHNGGQLQFGPDKLLYLAPGDGGGADDPGENAQDPASLLGKLLRIKPRKKGGYRSPQSNPYVGEAGRDEIYALGLRNPYRFSFDRATGDVSIGDVGQDQEEELDHETLAATRGANFGWDNIEGNQPNEAPSVPPPNYRAPIHTYPDPGASAITAGYVVRGGSLPTLAGRLLYADYFAGDIRSVNPDAADPSSTDASTGLDVASPTSFGEGRKGKIYVVSHGGPVYRIVSR